MLREIAEGIADFIREDEYLRLHGEVAVVVEDKADVRFEVERAVGELGVLALVSVVGFSRTDRSPVVQGNIEFQITLFEHPSLNREDPDTLTAQGVAEHLAKLLHYKRFPFLAGQMIFKDMGRDDVDEANIVRMNYEAHTRLGFEDRHFHPPAAQSAGDENTNQT